MPSARHSSKLALSLLVAIMGFMTPAAAQQEVQIMVNGPWAYVPTPTPTPPVPPATIVIATPNLPAHKPVEIFDGENADQFLSHSSANGIEIANTGIYTLTISGLADCGPAPSPTPTPVPQAYPLNGVSVSNVLQGQINGYAISIPRPCYYTSYLESRSKIDPVDPDSVNEQEHTTWMVLHYKVNSVGTATVSGFATPVNFVNNDQDDVPAISIVMGSVFPDDTDSRCDSLSVLSLKQEAQLFNATLHVHFPSLAGHDQTHNYKKGCADQTKLLSEQSFGQIIQDIRTVESFLSEKHIKLEEATAALNRIQTAINALGKPPADVGNELQEASRRLRPQPLPGGRALIKTENYASSTTAGAGDCRGAQLNIDGTIP